MTKMWAPDALVALLSASTGSRFKTSTRQSATSCSVLSRKVLPSSTKFHIVVACLAASPWEDMEGRRESDNPSLSEQNQFPIAVLCIPLGPDLSDAGGLLLAEGRKTPDLSDAGGLLLALVSGKLSSVVCLDSTLSDAGGLLLPLVSRPLFGESTPLRLELSDGGGFLVALNCGKLSSVTALGLAVVALSSGKLSSVRALGLPMGLLLALPSVVGILPFFFSPPIMTGGIVAIRGSLR